MAGTGVGTISFTLTAGVAGTVTVQGGNGAPMSDGLYTIQVIVDSAGGIQTSVATPQGCASNQSARNAPGVNA
jgi:hypothetical protein